MCILISLGDLIRQTEKNSRNKFMLINQYIYSCNSTDNKTANASICFVLLLSGNKDIIASSLFYYGRILKHTLLL